MAGAAALLGAAMTMAMRRRPVLATGRAVSSGAERCRGRFQCRRDRQSKVGGSTETNSAFDDHRASVLRRLADEEREFKQFLARIRVTRDKEEFDAFLADRRRSDTA